MIIETFSQKTIFSFCFVHQRVGDDIKCMPYIGQNWLHGSTSLQMERLWFVELWPNRSSLQSRVSLTGNGSQLGRTDGSYLRTDRCQPILTNAVDYFHNGGVLVITFFYINWSALMGFPPLRKTVKITLIFHVFVIANQLLTCYLLYLAL